MNPMGCQSDAAPEPEQSPIPVLSSFEDKSRCWCSDLGRQIRPELNSKGKLRKQYIDILPNMGVGVLDTGDNKMDDKNHEDHMHCPRLRNLGCNQIMFFMCFILPDSECLFVLVMWFLYLAPKTIHCVAHCLAFAQPFEIGPPCLHLNPGRVLNHDNHEQWFIKSQHMQPSLVAHPLVENSTNESQAMLMIQKISSRSASVIMRYLKERVAHCTTNHAGILHVGMCQY